MKCPVCGNEAPFSPVCKKCGFDDIRCIFLSETKRDEWVDKVVQPYAFQYLLSRLTPSEKDVAKKRFGVFGGKVISREELAQEKNVCVNRIMQIEAKIIRRVRRIWYFRKKVENEKLESCVDKEEKYETLFEDNFITVKYVCLGDVLSIDRGQAKTITLLITNKFREPISVCLKNVEVNGILNQSETTSFLIPENKTGLNRFNLIYQDKLIGNIENCISVSFDIYYTTASKGLPWCNIKKIATKL